MCDTEKKDKVFDGRIVDGFYDIKRGAGKIHILCQMFDNEISHNIETDESAFIDLTEIIVKDSLKHLAEGLRIIALTNPELDCGEAVERAERL